MSERICPACSAVVPPRLKFCRECGGRVEDAPAADTGPAAVPDDSGDATMMAAMPRKPASSAPTRITDSADNSGDATMLGAFTARPSEPEPATMAPDPEREQVTMAPAGEPEPATMAPPAAPEEEPATIAPADADLGKTMMTPPEPAVATDSPVATGEETILGALPSPAPAPVEEPEPEPDPVPITDDLDADPEENTPTLQREMPRPPPPAPLPPAAGAAVAASLPEGGVRLEHWSPKVKTAVVTLTKAETIVGRDRGDLKYPEDNHLSKKHARFFQDAQGRFCVEDLGAINGTYIRLRTPVKLEHRDILFLGRHAFRFELLQYEDQDDRTIEGDPLTKVQGVQGRAPRARLVKRQAEGFRGVPFFFGTQRYVLGRTDGTHNFQKDDLMSRRHAALEFKEGDYWLEDLGSQNGTFLRLRGARPLESGDVVMMGDQYFKVP